MTRQISKSITVNAPTEQAYNMWADFSQFPNFMEHVKSVTITGPKSSHWVVAGPAGSQIDWNAELTRADPYQRLAWNTKDNKGSMTTSGQVTFTPLPQDQTEVTVTMQYTPPAGAVGDWLSNILMKPEESVAADLRRFKEKLEKSNHQTNGSENDTIDDAIGI
jgi:uncharacterized membrane protein